MSNHNSTAKLQCIILGIYCIGHNVGPPLLTWFVIMAWMNNQKNHSQSSLCDVITHIKLYFTDVDIRSWRSYMDELNTILFYVDVFIYPRPNPNAVSSNFVNKRDTSTQPIIHKYILLTIYCVWSRDFCAKWSDIMIHENTQVKFSFGYHMSKI